MYAPCRGPGYAYPSAGDLFPYSRWPFLSSLTLINLHCPSAVDLNAAATFSLNYLNICERMRGATGVRRVQLVGWTEVEDGRRLAKCIPGVV